MARMAWMGTLRQMKEHRTIIKASCRERGCGHSWYWPLKDLITIYGEDGDLWDKHPPCQKPGCDGEIVFLASLGRSTPARPLVSQ
jgi:hypothetical protein